MKFRQLGNSVGSKIIPRSKGGVPAIERTEGEKIVLARKFLESRNFVVLPMLVNSREVCAHLGCSAAHLKNLSAATDFPRPFDIGALKSKIDGRSTPRWSSVEIKCWMESNRSNAEIDFKHLPD